MLEQSAEWTGKWVADKLREKPGIQGVEVLTSQVLRIVRKELQPFIAATIASPCVNAEPINYVLQTSYSVEMIVNIPKESYWTREAITLAAKNSVAFGGFGDLISAIAVPNVRQYVNKEFAFVERILRQHSSVSGLEREYDRKYIVKRKGLANVSVVLLNEYELTADHVRTARDRYGSFSAILLTNPYAAAPTSLAKQAADSIKAAIFTQGQFLSRLRDY